jgi:hypothetical protein
MPGPVRLCWVKHKRPGCPEARNRRPHGAFLLPSMACTVVACPSTCWSAGLSACLLANASLGVSTQTRDRLLEQLFHLGEFPSAWKYTAHHHGSSGLSRAGREAGRLGWREEWRKEDRKEGREAGRPEGREGGTKTRSRQRGM